MTINYDGPERRQHFRHRAHFLTQYRITQPPEVIMSIGKREFEAVMLDLSEGGLAILTNHEIPFGSAIHLSWTLINPHAKDEDRIRDFALDGEVRECGKKADDEFRLGITFVNIGEGDRRAIADFIKSNRR